MTTIGSKFVIIATVEREAKHGETVDLPGQEPFELNNLRRNKFWATIPGLPQPILCCSDCGEDPQAPFKAAALVKKHFPTLFL